MSKGYLFLIGNKADSSVIYKRMIEIAGGNDKSRIAIIPSTDQYGRNAATDFESFFINELGLPKENVWTLPVTAFDEATDEGATEKESIASQVALAEKLGRHNIIQFTGGDQREYVDFLKKNKIQSPLLDAIGKVYHDGGIIAATSEGVNILAGRSIAADDSEEILLSRVMMKEDDESKVEILEGLGLIDSFTFDTHLEMRGRLVRLSDAVVLTGNKFGVGISEKTAVIIHPDMTLEVIGNGNVLLCDHSKARLISKPPEQLHARDINVTLMSAGDKYKPLTNELFPDQDKESILNIPYFDANDYHVSLSVFKEYDTSQILINYMLDNEAKDVIALMDYDKVFSHDDVSAFMRLIETDETQAWFRKSSGEGNAETLNRYSGANVHLDVIPVKYSRENKQNKNFDVVLFGTNNDIQVVVFENLTSLPICDAKILIYDSNKKLIFKKGSDRYGRAVFQKLFKAGAEYSMKITYDNEEKLTSFTFDKDMTGICIY